MRRVKHIGIRFGPKSLGRISGLSTHVLSVIIIDRINPTLVQKTDGGNGVMSMLVEGILLSHFILWSDKAVHVPRTPITTDLYRAILDPSYEIDIRIGRGSSGLAYVVSLVKVMPEQTLFLHLFTCSVAPNLANHHFRSFSSFESY